MNDKKRATTYNNHNNIIIMIALAKLIMAKHQVAAPSNFESFNIRLPSAIIMMLSKAEFKAQHKRVLNFESDHLPFSSDSNSIINPSARDTRKRLKHILSNQSTFKPRSFTSLIFTDITRKQAKVVFLKVRSNKRIFERDFPRYNKTLNKIFRQFKRTPLNKDYVLIYLSDNIIILNNFTPESSSKSINDDDLFDIIVQLIKFNPLTSIQSLHISNNISKSQS